MKLLIPIAIIAIIIVGVFAYMKLGKSIMNPASLYQTTPNVAVQKIPVTGNPDDVAAAVVKAAGDEQTAVGTESGDAVSVTADNSEVGAINESVNENEF